MAKHEFGIMIDELKSGEDYIEYIPEKYNCTSVDDIFIEPIVDCFFLWCVTGILLTIRKTV